MAFRTHRWALLAAVLSSLTPLAKSQVFVVGEKSATDSIATDFKHTEVDLPSTPLTERGRRDLLRNLEAEQGFAHRALPMGPGLTLRANGPLTPGPDLYKKMIYEKGQAAGPGDRVMITSLTFKPDRIIIDVNGGPYAKHRILSHISFNDNPIVQPPAEQPTGSRITLVFEGRVPEISAPEVKALLDPVIDFGVKTSEQAYADTLPPLLKDAIAAHDVLVGMNHRMVLAALGPPENKIRERNPDTSSGHYEEWIYGHVPATVRFVRFQGDRVAVVEIAELGKPLQVHQTDETGGYNAPVPTREIALGDAVGKPEDGTAHPASSAPTLLKPGEAAPNPGVDHRVQFPASPATPADKSGDRPGSIPAPPSAPPSNLVAIRRP